jgi:hypothetical protein
LNVGRRLPGGRLRRRHDYRQEHAVSHTQERGRADHCEERRVQRMRDSADDMAGESACDHKHEQASEWKRSKPGRHTWD